MSKISLEILERIVAAMPIEARLVDADDAIFGQGEHAAGESIETDEGRFRIAVAKGALPSEEEHQAMLYAISHDLQEPVRTVTNFSRLLREHLQEEGVSLGGDTATYLGFIEEGASRLRARIGALLQLSRIRSRMAPPQPIDTPAVVAHLALAVSEELETVGGLIEVGALPVVHGDELQIANVLRELIANAIRYRGERAPRIQISGARHEGWASVEVADNGCGISERHQGRVFDLFQTGAQPDGVRGTGAGLSIAHRIAECHGGRLRLVESEPGAGSRFRLELPGTD